MRLGRLLLDYILWHYTRAFIDLFRFFGNLLWSVYNIFSVPFLLLSLFAPFERMHENYSGSTDGDDFFENIMANIILRVVGAVLRLTICIIGLCCMWIVLVAALAAFILWPFMPILISTTFALGIYLLL